MPKRTFLEKSDSKKVYGLAILLMLFHHLFCDPQRIFFEYVSFFPKSWIVQLSWFGRICIGLYAFISGYGMQVSTATIKIDRISSLIKQQYLYVFIIAKKFFIKYWIVCVCFVLPFFILTRTFPIKDIIFLILGLSEKYNAEWWYIKNYLIILMLFPLLKAQEWYVDQKKYGVVLKILLWGIWVSFFFLIFVFVKIIFFHSISNKYFFYSLIFIEGFLFSKYRLFEKVSIYASSNAFSILLLVAIVTGRLIVAKDATYKNGDIVFAPLLIYSFICLSKKFQKNVFLKYLEKLGNHSTYMWLTHTFFAYYYFQWLIFAPREALLIFLWLIAISVVCSCLLQKLEKRVYAKLRV